MFKDGLLIELDQDGRPILDLWWTGDTPHPQDASDPWREKTTCELLWVAQSHTGNYHDNMDADLFTPWVENGSFQFLQGVIQAKRWCCAWTTPHTTTSVAFPP